MPCTFVCLTPVIIATWPSIVSCVVGAAAAIGFTAVSSVNKEEVETKAQTVEVELEGSSVLEGYTGQEQQFVKDGVTLTVKSNEQGRVILCAKGDESKEALRQKALTFAGKLQQAYSYHKAMTQLRTSGFNVVSENVGQDKEIHITLRRW
jgi:hypothetical protein